MFLATRPSRQAIERFIEESQRSASLLRRGRIRPGLAGGLRRRRDARDHRSWRGSLRTSESRARRLETLRIPLGGGVAAGRIHRAGQRRRRARSSPRVLVAQRLPRRVRSGRSLSSGRRLDSRTGPWSTTRNRARRFSKCLCVRTRARSSTEFAPRRGREPSWRDWGIRSLAFSRHASARIQARQCEWPSMRVVPESTWLLTASAARSTDRVGQSGRSQRR